MGPGSAAKLKPLTEGTAAYHVTWQINGVDYDSDQYGPPTAKIDEQGWACFSGGVGWDARIQSFKLTGLSVRVTLADGTTAVGDAKNLRWKYQSSSEIVQASAEFALRQDAGEIAEPMLADQ
jgi:hypothetical protein